MSSGSITDYLINLNEADSLAKLREAHSQKSAFVFKVDNDSAPIKTYIDCFSHKKIVLSEDLNNHKPPIDKEFSFKFYVGTDVFFIKTSLKTHLNFYYIDINQKVIQLQRRKESRFNIPKRWNQTATFSIRKNTDKFFRCQILDISTSGIRFEAPLDVKNPPPDLQREDTVYLKFQIHKRAEISASAAVRFVLKKPDEMIVGLEFVDIAPAHKERVASIVEDIGLYNITYLS